MPLHQSVKLVYDITLDKRPEGNPKLYIYIREEEGR